MAFSDIETKNRDLVRKALGGGLFIQPSTGAALTTLTTGANSDLRDLEAIGFVEAGLMTTDGMSTSRAQERSEIRSAFRLSPTRTDMTADTETLSVTLQETSALTISLATGVDIDDLEVDPTTGELSIPRSEIPTRKSYRLLALAVDITNEGELYIARYWPNAEITEYADQAITNGDEAFTWGFTFTAYNDPALGYAGRTILGGPGFKAQRAEAGFPAPTP